MFSKLKPLTRLMRVAITPVRKAYLPPTQYDQPLPKRLHLGYVLRVYWETVPLFAVTCVSLGCMFASIAWACKHKVDVVFTNSGGSISRTMDLRNPTVHKMVLINQYYEPWPEMQDVLDKMARAEERLMEGQ
ncbi:uncharacterized protein LOC121731956 [Aricia agestis]|uniref:uncharacterized protein LOC121731956 n=1 Tax=Aricia agestis TaxID=91739 RepID=UPI001C204A7B|nr:uncharacterized protein LOC121731956 [Aricia agestis]